MTYYKENLMEDIREEDNKIRKVVLSSQKPPKNNKTSEL